MVTRSNRVGCARKARAGSAGTVAGKIFEPKQFRHLFVNSTPGEPAFELNAQATTIVFRLFPLSGRSGHGVTWLLARPSRD